MGMGSMFPGMGNALRGARDRQWEQELANAAVQPIPGLTGSTGTSTPIPGLLGQTPAGPGLNQIPLTQIPPPGPSPFQAAGPYALQAQMLAGLLGHRQTPGIPTSGYQGLLGRRFIPGGK